MMTRLDFGRENHWLWFRRPDASVSTARYAMLLVFN